MADPSHSANAEWFARARRVIPGGVDSPVRSFASVGGTPYTVARGVGPFVFDVEGTRYIDLVQSYGAVLLGHAHPVVTEAITRAAALGSTFGAPTPGEVLLAEAICARVPGCEQVRLVSSGTEAAMSAVRLARGATGRDRVVKFDGCYHGHSDGLLAGGGSGVAMLGLPGSVGVSLGAVAATAVVPYNVVPELSADVACVIVEPVAANMNLVPPAPGFLAGLRAACDAAGALLIFDEVITGFRLGAGGATAWSGVTPDLWCFGKVIGGGLPVGALAGPRDLLAQLAPDGPVYQAGTLSGNPLATAAGLAVLTHVSDDDYAELGTRAGHFARQLASAISAGGLEATVPVVGPLIGLFLAPAGDGPGGAPPPTPMDYMTARVWAGNGVYPRFFHAMLRRGVALAPGSYEVMFPGFSHNDDVLGQVVAAAGESALEVAKELADGT
ncbi:MAG TPA: glutamate-1-semialdehyde 2,1-aminomutase [Acidimicrobiales bacterium]|nr:glutamate-1-semialdehyde 2,1-aminomutase [Acidimicrobiales bacterium]